MRSDAAGQLGRAHVAADPAEAEGLAEVGASNTGPLLDLDGVEEEPAAVDDTCDDAIVGNALPCASEEDAPSHRRARRCLDVAGRLKRPLGLAVFLLAVGAIAAGRGGEDERAQGPTSRVDGASPSVEAPRVSARPRGAAGDRRRRTSEPRASAEGEPSHANVVPEARPAGPPEASPPPPLAAVPPAVPTPPTPEPAPQQSAAIVRQEFGP